MPDSLAHLRITAAMSGTTRTAVALLFGMSLVLASACRSSNSVANLPVSAAAATVVSACGSATGCVLHPEVPMPEAFPGDFPLYPGARLTMVTSVSSSPVPGQSTWGMVWETLDSRTAVEAYYEARLNQGHWITIVSGRPDDTYSVVFNSRTDANAGGMLNVVVVSQVTKISLALTGS